MKYILKKEYPGSPKLGNIIDNLENDWIENYPEFWEEVKDYEILSLARLCSIKPTITDVSDYGDEFIEAMLKCDNARIHSIKRLSDSQIFTIGDELKNNQKIISISLIDNQIRIYSQYSFYYLKDIVKVRQKLFTTFDNVDIFKGDISFGVNSNFKLSEVKHINKLYIYPNVKEFSTKEKAEEYILLNKPCLSLTEIWEIIDTSSYLKLKSKIEDLVKSKIQQSV